MEKNLDLVQAERLALDSPRSRCHFDWEAGHLVRNINRNKVVGGIIVPTQDDWKDVEGVMKKLQETRSSLIAEAHPFDPANARTKLLTGSERIDKEGYPFIFERSFVASVIHGCHDC